MIKVILETLTPSREPLPANIRGLDAYTLQNLQAELDPVPADLVGIEYWPEITVNPDFDPMTHKLEGETLTVNAGDKTVTATAIAVPLSQDELDAIAAQSLAEAVAAVQGHLDTVARTRNYDGILSLCSYASSANPVFGPEGQAGVVWRDACWAYTYQVQADVLAGNRTIPTTDELIAELPVIAWP